MKNKKVDWDLWLRAGREPLELARELLFNMEETLDDADECALAKVDGLEGVELVAWLSKRGPEPRELPAGVPSNTELVARFVDTWDPREGFFPDPESQPPTIWNIAIQSIEPGAWDDLIKTMLRGHLTDPRQRTEAIRTLRLPCDLFKTLCARDSLGQWIPQDVRRAREPWLHFAAEILEHLASVHRYPKPCLETLLQVARDSVTTGDLLPLWTLDRLGLLGEVSDARSVLPARVWFGFESHLLSDELRRDLPYARWPVSLALRWPGGGGRGWVLDQILTALRAGAPRDRVEQFLLGVTEAQEAEGCRGDPEVTPALAAWLAEPGELDALMRATIDAGAPLPSAWMTVIRDLAEGADGAWARALHWADWLLDALAGESGPMELYIDRAPRSLTVADVEIRGANAAVDWIAWRAPLADVDDVRLEATMERVDALRSSRPSDYYGRPFSFPFSTATSERWMRVAELPPTPARRGKLVAMLRQEPGLLHVAHAERALDRLGVLTEDELPPFDGTPWRLVGVDGETLSRYQRLGGEAATKRMLEAFRAQVLEYLRKFDETLPFVAACARAVDEETQAQIAKCLVDMDLARLASRGLQLAALFSVPFDLVSTARERIDVCHERFEELPNLPGVDELLLTRLEWLVAEGEAAWTRALTSCPSWPPGEHDPNDLAERCREVVDRDVVALAGRLGQAIGERERLAACLRDRVRRGGLEHVVALFDALAATGVRRRELVDLACDRLLRTDEEPWRVSTTPLPAVIGARMASRTAWDEDGLTLVQRLLDPHPDSLRRACDIALGASLERPGSKPAGGKTDPLLDAMLLAFARAFAARAHDAMERGDVPGAARALRAIAELDAPTRARPLMVPLRRLAKGTERLEAAVEVCEQLLRSKADRAPTLGGIYRALDAFGLPRR